MPKFRESAFAKYAVDVGHATIPRIQDAKRKRASLPRAGLPFESIQGTFFRNTKTLARHRAGFSWATDQFCAVNMQSDVPNVSDIWINTIANRAVSACGGTGPMVARS
jgi:hypothetical protein